MGATGADSLAKVQTWLSTERIRMIRVFEA